MKIPAVLSLMMLSPLAFGYTQDTGKITRVYVNPTGSISIQLEGGFTKANEGNQCQSNNGWAGHKNADPVLKSAILAAKAANQSVTVTIEGCEGASWLKIKDMYIN